MVQQQLGVMNFVEKVLLLLTWTNTLVLARGYPWVTDVHDCEMVPRVRKLSGHDLNAENTKREAVQLISVDRSIS